MVIEIRISIISYVYNEIRENIFEKMSKICRDFVKDSLKTHQNRVPRALGVLKNNSSCSFPPWGLSQSIFWMDKSGFYVKTCAKIVKKKLYIYIYIYY